MNIHFSEIFLVILVAFLVIKPEQLPGIALKLGKWIKQIKKLASTKITDT